MDDKEVCPESDEKKYEGDHPKPAHTVRHTLGNAENLGEAALATQGLSSSAESDFVDVAHVTARRFHLSYLRTTHQNPLGL